LFYQYILVYLVLASE
jgi:acetyl-CoA C-acetyltransferase